MFSIYFGGLLVKPEFTRVALFMFTWGLVREIGFSRVWTFLNVGTRPENKIQMNVSRANVWVERIEASLSDGSVTSQTVLEVLVSDQLWLKYEHPSVSDCQTTLVFDQRIEVIIPQDNICKRGTITPIAQPLIRHVTNR